MNDEMVEKARAVAVSIRAMALIRRTYQMEDAMTALIADSLRSAVRDALGDAANMIRTIGEYRREHQAMLNGIAADVLALRKKWEVAE